MVHHDQTMAGKSRRFKPVPRDLWINSLLNLAAVFASAVAVYLLVGLSLGVGLGAVGFAVFLLLLIFSIALSALPAHPYSQFGFANLVTAIRAAIVCIIAAAVFFADNLHIYDLFAWLLVAAVAVVLVLDGADGYLARRFEQESEFGARFDMEIDALLILVLSVAALILGKAGSWVLLIGIMRYGFALAQWMMQRLRADLPASFRRKLICVVQVGGLCLILAPPVRPFLSNAFAVSILTSLIYSFAVDVRYLLTRETKVR